MSQVEQDNLRQLEAREACQILIEISELLNTGLDPELLMLCVRLIEYGVNPEALAQVIIDIRREQNALKTAESEHERNI